MLQSIANLLEALHRNDIAYCNLKGNDQHLKNALTGESDIDVLFDVTQKRKLELILSILGFKEFVAIRPRRFKDIVDFFILDSESGKVIHLHTYYGFTIGEPFLKGYQPDIASHILKSRMYNQEYGLYCIQPALELTLLYLTETLKLRYRDFIRLFLKPGLALSEKVIYQHDWLKARTSPAEIRDTISMVFAGQPSIIKLVESEFSQKNLQQLAPYIRKALVKYRIYSPLGGLWLRWHREATLKIRRKLARVLDLPILSMRINPRGGAIVEIIEQNDALNAAIIGAIKNTFSNKIDVYQVVFRRREAENSMKSAPPGKYSVTRCIRVVLRTAEIWKKLKRIQSAKRKGVLVICDHYPLHHNGLSNGNRPLLRGLKDSKNGMLRYLARLESAIYSQIKLIYSPDLVFQSTDGTDLNASDTPDANMYPGIDLETTGSNECALPNKGRLVKVGSGKPMTEKLGIFRREIWKDL